MHALSCSFFHAGVSVFDGLRSPRTVLSKLVLLPGAGWSRLCVRWGPHVAGPALLVVTPCSRGIHSQLWAKCQPSHWPTRNTFSRIWNVSVEIGVNIYGYSRHPLGRLFLMAISNSKILQQCFYYPESTILHQRSELLCQDGIVIASDVMIWQLLRGSLDWRRLSFCLNKAFYMRIKPMCEMDLLEMA